MKAAATKRDHEPVSLYDMDLHLWTQRTAAPRGPTGRQLPSRRAPLETGLAMRHVPSRCPYTVAQVLDEACLPGNIVGR